MPRYIWNGPEQELSFGVTVSTLTIEEFQDRPADLERLAVGSLLWKDYVEGGQFKDWWHARKIWDGNKGTTWVVRRDERGYSFCSAESINAKIKRFVAEKLEHAEGLWTQSNTEVIEGPARFTAERIKYVGQCVCATLINPKTSPFFDWQLMTGGKFPQHCFECSCGKKWWRYNPDKGLWASVADPAAWTMFCEYNGVARYTIGALQDGFHLLQTLRDRGMIPIG